MNYYNEFDPKAAAWLRELIKQNLIAPGVVDERSITEVQPYELTQYKQCHFFAGIGGWSYALRLAGWPDDEPVWTGSCPCQPFSGAAKDRKGIADPRHLWPQFNRLISKCNPSVSFGEQVASPDGRKWLSGVRADLEALGYAVGASDLCAAGVKAPHPRHRLYWVADSGHKQSGWCPGPSETKSGWPRDQSTRCGATLRLENSTSVRLEGWADRGERLDAKSVGLFPTGSSDDACRLEHAKSNGRIERRTEPGGRGSLSGCWDMFDVVHCTDGKARRFEPGSFPLAHGLPHRVGLLRGYGNAIVPQVAAGFIKAFTS